MDVVTEKIEACRDRDPPKGGWMHDWRLDSAINIVDSPRYTCFVEVATRAEKLLLDNRETIVTTRVSLASNIQDIAVDAPSIPAPAWLKRLFIMLCYPSFEKLSQILRKRNVSKMVHTRTR
jgi:hypothetical protein